MQEKKDHLPVYGVGPIYGVLIIAATAAVCIRDSPDVHRNSFSVSQYYFAAPSGAILVVSYHPYEADGREVA